MGARPAVVQKTEEQHLSPCTLQLSVTKAAASSRDLYERKYLFFMFIFVPIFKSKIDLKEFSVARKDDQR